MAIAGVQKCGCITYVNARPEDLDRDDKKALMKVVKSGGSIRRATVDELRADPNFLNLECPHDPKGWEREVWKPTARGERASYRDSTRKRIYVKRSRMDDCGYLSGETAKWDGKWWATPGYFSAVVHPFEGEKRLVAQDLSTHPATDVDPLGPFDKEREAKQVLIDIAVAAYERKRGKDS